mmetsp:Transcript_35966/g.48602  ORF Transcript_35966/g.48602 Transcript_35966/m.48602 type:complete len:428 (-) Transcript_35966:229-1512(-)
MMKAGTGDSDNDFPAEESTMLGPRSTNSEPRIPISKRPKPDAIKSLIKSKKRQTPMGSWSQDLKREEFTAEAAEDNAARLQKYCGKKRTSSFKLRDRSHQLLPGFSNPKDVEEAALMKNDKNLRGSEAWSWLSQDDTGNECLDTSILVRRQVIAQQTAAYTFHAAFGRLGEAGYSDRHNVNKYDELERNEDEAREVEPPPERCSSEEDEAKDDFFLGQDDTGDATDLGLNYSEENGDGMDLLPATFDDNTDEMDLVPTPCGSSLNSNPLIRTEFREISGFTRNNKGGDRGTSVVVPMNAIKQCLERCLTAPRPAVLRLWDPAAVLQDIGFSLEQPSVAVDGRQIFAAVIFMAHSHNRQLSTRSAKVGEAPKDEALKPSVMRLSFPTTSMNALGWDEPKISEDPGDGRIARDGMLVDGRPVVEIQFSQ